MNIKFFLFAFLSLFLQSCQSTAPQECDCPEASKLFVFNDVVIDLRRKKWYTGPISAGIEDCSDSNHFCFASQYATLVMPKDCSRIQNGASFTANGYTSKIIGVVERASNNLGPVYSFLFSSDASPTTVFNVTRTSGVRGIYFSFSENLSRADMAYLLDNEDVLYESLPTREPMFACYINYESP